ncbi:hypothetical protein Tco_1298629 [Tanacetum coccineum]
MIHLSQGFNHLEDEGSLSLNELTVLCISLSKKVEGLESELKETKQVYNADLTKLVRRVKKLEQTVKASQSRRRARVVLFDDEEVLEDPSKQGRIIVEIDQNPSILLVQDKGTTWFQEDAEIQGRTSGDTEILLYQEEPTELVEDLGSGEKGEKEISTADVPVSTAIPERQVYIRRSEEKRKDKGKTIMLDLEASVKVQEELDAEMAKQLQEENYIARQEQEKYDLAQVLELQKHLDKRKDVVAEVRKNMCIYLKNQGGFKLSHSKGMSYEDIRPIFKRVCDQNHTFVPKDSEIEKEVIKRHGFDLQQKQLAEEEKEKKDDDSSNKPARGRRKKTLARKRARDDVAMDESLANKYPIVDWKTHVLSENFMYYQIIRADGSSKNYKIFSEMLDDFDIQDVIDLHRLNQQDYNLINWRLCDSCGIHILLMNTGIAIHMMVEKKYLLTQEMLSRMLIRRLEIDHESEMAFELLKFTRSQL